MARHVRASSILAALLLALSLALPTVSFAQHEEYEARAFESWLAGAPCDELEDEAIFLQSSLTLGRQGVRNWKMSLRLQLRAAHRRYAERCIKQLLYWSYECLSIQRTMGVLRSALADDDLLGDQNAERQILTGRREKIEQRRARVCEPEAKDAIEEEQ